MKESVQEYYKGTGYNVTDLQKHLKTLKHSGYDESYDGSLLVVYLEGLTVVCGCGGLTFIENR